MKNTRSAFLFILLIAVAGSTVFAQTAKASPKSKLFDASQLLKDIETLSSDVMEGRSAALPSMKLAREYVKRRFTESGIEPMGDKLEQPFEIKRRGGTGTIEGVNFVGVIKGSKFPEKFIVITAHYDHVGVREGQIYNGADDNASGTAALFALASHFKKKQPDHSLVFVAFDAEEMGLQGARYFVGNLPVPKESILLNVNMDMLSRNEKGELYASGSFSYPQFRPALEKVQKKAKVKLLLGHDNPKQGHDDWTNQSDQGAFHAAKIPFIYFGVEDHADYHKPTDDFENIQPEFYVGAVETVIGAVRQLDGSR